MNIDHCVLFKAGRELGKLHGFDYIQENLAFHIRGTKGLPS